MKNVSGIMFEDEKCDGIMIEDEKCGGFKQTILYSR